MTLQEDYPELWNKIEKKEIPKNKIDEILLKFVSKQIKEARESKRSDLDIGDAFGIGIQHGIINGYKFSSEVEDFLYELGEYKVEIAERNVGTMNSLDEVERKLKEIAETLKINLN